MTLIPIPVREQLDSPQSTDDLLAWAKRLHEDYEHLHAVLSQNISRLNLPTSTVTQKSQPNKSVGHGMGIELLQGFPMNLATSTFKNSLSLANGTTRNQVNVTFTYLGVGPFIVGSGAAVTYTADISTAGINGLDAGTEAANTWYYVYVIAGDTTLDVNDTTGNTLQSNMIRRGVKVASLLSTSATPTLPFGFTHYRRVGFVRNNNNSDLFRFYNIGDWYYWNEPLQNNTAGVTNGDFMVVNTTTAATTFTGVSCSKVVPTSSTLIIINGQENGTSGQRGLRARPTGGNQDDTGSQSITTESAVSLAIGTTIVATNSSQSIDYHAEVGDTAILTVKAYYDPV